MARRFGERIRELRKAKSLGQRGLAERIGVSHTYVSKIENGKLDFGDYPSEQLIHSIAKILDCDSRELLLLAGKIPPDIRKRVVERPDAFRRFAELDNETIDWLLSALEKRQHPDKEVRDLWLR
jgi:transcriptional regulator with XRE-family HTH domain